MKNNFDKKQSERFPMVNFFDLKDEDLVVLNPYDFNAAINRLKNLTIEDVKDDLRHFQKKEFEFRNYEEENSFSLDKIRFITSTKNENDSDFILLKDLSDYLIPEKKSNKEKDDPNNKDIPDKRISLDIKSQEGGKKEILIKCLVDPRKLSENIFYNFINKSEFDKAKEVRARFEQSLKENDKNDSFRFSMKIEMNSLVKIYHNKNKGTYFFDLQSPPIFRTNFFISYDDKDNKQKSPKDENCIFPFRNFLDEFQNLKYRHFIIMIEKKTTMETPENENDVNFDTNEELFNTLENLFKNRSGETDKNKFIEKDIVLKVKDEKEKMNNLSDFFDYNSENKKDIKRKLKDLNFLTKNEKQKKSKKNDDDNDSEKEDEKKEEKEEEEEEKEEENEKYNDQEVIKLFYQVVALVSELILSYYNGVKLLRNLLIENKYRDDIFEKCTNEIFPIFFNLTLTKILDKYQNSFKEKSLKRFEKEMTRNFKALYAFYETEGLKETLKPSKNEILMRVQRCVVTPTYILFTPYVLEEGNRVLRKFIDSVNYSMLCTFKMDSLEEGRWNNQFLMEYIKFILSKGFYLGEKKFRFFNYSQSQFRNFSCWLLTNPEEIIPKLGNFSKIKQLSKYAARISQTLTTTIETISIPKDKIEFIPDVKSKDEKISVILSEQISKKLKLDYIPSCFQGRFLGCKGVWTTMWDDYSGTIYCRDSQIKFEVEKKNENFFELCDYSRYIQSYLNRQIILLLNSLGISDDKFMKKLTDYKSKLNDEKFVLSLVHYPEWNQILKVMNHCGINKENDRLLKSLIESNIDILYNDIKKKARIYVEKSAYVIGIMDEYGILEYGEAFLHIKRDNLDIILDQECAVAKCPCLHPGDIRVLRFKKYNKNDESTKKYEVFNNYANVVIFPSKGKRPHPDECSGSDLDGDNYFIFYDSDLVPSKNDLFELMSY